jgi:RNA polymerase sigma factor (sigma-70 family)
MIGGFFIMTQEKSIAEIVKSAQNGDKHALEVLYIEHSKKVYYLALKILRNKEDAEDITSDVFVTVCEKLTELKEPEHFIRWLNRITANKCTNAFRKNRNRIMINANDNELNGITESELDFVEETNPLLIPDKALDNAETAQMIVDIVDSLPDPQRLCVYYYYYEQLTIAQIAELLDTNENAVKGRLHLARKKIRRELEALDEREGVKLYSVSPLMLTPAFKLALEGFEMSVELTQGIWGAIAANTATVTAAATTTVTATAATTGIIASLNAKIITIATCAVVACGVTAGVIMANFDDESEAEPVIAVVSTEFTSASVTVNTQPSVLTIVTDESVTYTTTEITSLEETKATTLQVTTTPIISTATTSAAMTSPTVTHPPATATQTAAVTTRQQSPGAPQKCYDSEAIFPQICESCFNERTAVMNSIENLKNNRNYQLMPCAQRRNTMANLLYELAEKGTAEFPYSLIHSISIHYEPQMPLGDRAVFMFRSQLNSSWPKWSNDRSGVVVFSLNKSEVYNVSIFDFSCGHAGCTICKN